MTRVLLQCVNCYLQEIVCFYEIKYLFVCLGLMSLWNIWGHITTVPACSSGRPTLTNVLPHRNAMPQTQDTTPHPVTVYRHGANLSLCYPSMWNVTLEYTATHFNVLGETRPGNPSPTFHTHQRTFNLMLSWWSTVGSSVESTVPTGSWTRDLWCANPVRYPLAHSDFQNICISSPCTFTKSWLWPGKNMFYHSVTRKFNNAFLVGKDDLRVKYSLTLFLLKCKSMRRFVILKSLSLSHGVSKRP